MPLERFQGIKYSPGLSGKLQRKMPFSTKLRTTVTAVLRGGGGSNSAWPYWGLDFSYNHSPVLMLQNGLV